jgi:hypothetical protein
MILSRKRFELTIPAPPRHAVSRCDLRDRCCAGYESCVSCCLEPGHGAKERLPEVGGARRRHASCVWGGVERVLQQLALGFSNTTTCCVSKSTH